MASARASPCSSQVPAVDTERLETLVHDVWKEVSHIEDSDEMPRVTVEPAAIDMGQIE